MRVCGRSIAGVPVGTVAASVGLLFQHPRDQLFERTVLREAAFGLRQLVGKAGAEGRARAALAAVGLSAAAESVHPAELPASQQRLLALATVLAREPAVLALDEPTVGLDRTRPRASGPRRQRARRRGATAVVMVTHDLAYARADRAPDPSARRREPAGNLTRADALMTRVTQRRAPEHAPAAARTRRRPAMSTAPPPGRKDVRAAAALHGGSGVG